MGEQKTNVTAPPVVERFGEARHRDPVSPDSKKQWFQRGSSSETPTYNFIIPANLSEQTVRNDGIGHGWAEFEGISVSQDSNPQEFNGAISTDPNGKNFRFVDIAWQFILRSDIETFGSSTEEWASALLEKLELRKKNGKPMASWVLPMLKSIVNTTIPVKEMLAFKYAALTKLVFDGFLGDVHLYGDYGRTRGRAVRHFHVVLDEIMIRDFLQWYWQIYYQSKEQNGKKPAYEPPEFTILAHSLGSIMSFDSLVYAHIRDDIRRNDYTSEEWPESLPFPGYDFIHDIEKKNWNYLHGKLQSIWKAEQDNPAILDVIRHIIPNADELFNANTVPANGEKQKSIAAPDIPYVSWKNHVTNFITIGSPVDKFLALWSDNYLHLHDTSTVAVSAPEKMFHYNFCDEQDPVGHHLEEAMKTPVYQTLFNTDPIGNHDVVFRRYGIPGVAHNLYWTDQELFFGIIDKIIDTKTANTSAEFVWKEIHQKTRAFKSAKRWAYYLIPLITTLATTALVSYGIMNDSLLWRWLSIIAAVLLWVQPNLLTAYKDETVDSRKMARSWLEDKWNKIRPVRGIFSRLVSAAIEWRRILIVESLDSNTVPVDGTHYDVSERIAFQSQEMTDKPLKYVALLIAVAGLSLAGSLALGYTLYYPFEADELLHIHLFTHLSTISGPWLNAGKIAFFFTLSYSLVRFYVAGSFLGAWKRCRPE
ncbi:MAG TPA: hypothetical protein ENL07_00955 [Chlorobaculum parvum]|uniref:Uncharacterized protein n=1 Tax=Chlorobaculum parvum TaxID=274539 RepID=A0A7C5DDZ7_9CHLB|nr:hypothetical protein [Chlorobaculum parvum]